MGRRIVVWGATGSGKTSMGRTIAESLGLGFVELDAIRHHTGWDSTPWEEFRTILSERLETLHDGWVCDGAYPQVMDIVLARTDTLVWLHLPFRVTFCRLLKRTIVGAWTREPLYNPDGPSESWRMTFLSRRSILWWAITSHGPRERQIPERIAALPPAVRVYELRSAREVREFLGRIPGQSKDANSSSVRPV